MRLALICKSTWSGAVTGLKDIIIISILKTWKWRWHKVLGTESVMSQSQLSSEWACLSRTSVLAKWQTAKCPRPLCWGALSQKAIKVMKFHSTRLEIVHLLGWEWTLFSFRKSYTDPTLKTSDCWLLMSHNFLFCYQESWIRWGGPTFQNLLPG